MLRWLLGKYVRTGHIKVTVAGQPPFELGRPDPLVREAPLHIAFRTAAAALKTALHPDLHLGQTYMDGDLTIERGTLWDLMTFVGRNAALMPVRSAYHPAEAFQRALSRLRQHNAQRASRRHVAHHYDLSEKLYRLFLDEDMQYSCAYFDRPDVSLDEAQWAKKRHIAAKLALAPGQRVLDIGCGWGGMALYLAQQADIEVLGVTLSREQLAVARERAQKLGLGDRVRFELVDFRNLAGTFDRIVSVGMFEHVGTPNYATFFSTVARLLAPDGVAVLHSIGRSRGPSYTSAWTEKYIFPGGYFPALSEVMPSVERSGLIATDIEILRLHYAETLLAWRQRFTQRRGLLADLYNDRFCRMWEFYLASSEMGFRFMDLMVFQIQMTRSAATLPITRDYMVETERRTTVPAGIAASTHAEREPAITR